MWPFSGFNDKWSADIRESIHGDRAGESYSAKRQKLANYSYIALKGYRSVGSTAASISNLVGGGAITTAGVTAGTGTAGVVATGITTAVGGPIAAGVAASADAALSLYSWHKTKNHIKNLEEILGQIQSGAKFACDCADADGAAHHDHLPAVLQYIIMKKRKKKIQKGVGVIPAVGSMGTMAYQTARSTYKVSQGTRGQHRSEFAHILGQHLVRSHCVLAEAIVLELVGEDGFEHVYTSNSHDAAILLFEKMNSH